MYQLPAISSFGASLSGGLGQIHQMTAASISAASTCAAYCTAHFTLQAQALCAKATLHAASAGQTLAAWSAGLQATLAPLSALLFNPAVALSLAAVSLIATLILFRHMRPEPQPERSGDGNSPPPPPNGQENGQEPPRQTTHPHLHSRAATRPSHLETRPRSLQRANIPLEPIPEEPEGVIATNRVWQRIHVGAYAAPRVRFPNRQKQNKSPTPKEQELVHAQARLSATLPAPLPAPFSALLFNPAFALSLAAMSLIATLILFSHIRPESQPERSGDSSGPLPLPNGQKARQETGQVAGQEAGQEPLRQTTHPHLDSRAATRLSHLETQPRSLQRANVPLETIPEEPEGVIATNRVRPRIHVRPYAAPHVRFPKRQKQNKSPTPKEQELVHAQAGLSATSPSSPSPYPSTPPKEEKVQPQPTREYHVTTPLSHNSSRAHRTKMREREARLVEQRKRDYIEACKAEGRACEIDMLEQIEKGAFIPQSKQATQAPKLGPAWMHPYSAYWASWNLRSS